MPDVPDVARVGPKDRATGRAPTPIGAKPRRDNPRLAITCRSRTMSKLDERKHCGRERAAVSGAMR